MNIPLFQKYNNLEDKIPRIPLGSFPTKVEQLYNFGSKIGLQNIFIKRDDQSGEPYGGNKVRKLEFLLGKAREMGAEKVLTIGFAGSNHSLATSCYANKVGLQSISLLLPQPNARYVRDNLLMSLSCGTELHYCPNLILMALHLAKIITNQWMEKQESIYVIPTGGSSVIGTIGFVNAALELKEQIERNEIPEPDYIYVPMGTMGTAAGLITGLKYAGLKSRVIAVRVVEKIYADEARLPGLAQNTHNYLKSLDNNIPSINISINDFEVRHDFFGRQYALFTEEGINAIKLLQETEQVKLDGTYTGKTMAALISDAGKGILKDKAVLFWNTYNSKDYTDKIKGTDYKELPKEFHRFFEEDFQPLDKDES